MYFLRSPPLELLGPSEFSRAMVAKALSPSKICRRDSALALASSLERVMDGSVLRAIVRHKNMGGGHLLKYNGINETRVEVVLDFFLGLVDALSHVEIVHDSAGANHRVEPRRILETFPVFR